jgi:hypothetical protein
MEVYNERLVMRIFKNKWFHRFALRNDIDDNTLLEAIERTDKGLIDADLGGGLLKQRIARDGQGKSGGYRAIIFYRKEDKAFFMFGFAKNDQENLQKVRTGRIQGSGKIIPAAHGKTNFQDDRKRLFSGGEK